MTTIATTKTGIQNSQVSNNHDSVIFAPIIKIPTAAGPGIFPALVSVYPAEVGGPAGFQPAIIRGAPAMGYLAIKPHRRVLFRHGP